MRAVLRGTPEQRAQGAARASDLDFMRDETPKLLEVARSPASALPARPSGLHRCASSRRCRNCGRTGSRRPGGRRSPGRVRTLVDRRGRPGRRRPRSRRSCSPSHLGRWAQASVLNTGAAQGPKARRRRHGASACSVDRRRACWAHVASTGRRPAFGSTVVAFVARRTRPRATSRGPTLRRRRSSCSPSSEMRSSRLES
jgi:hypothetical protein